MKRFLVLFITAFFALTIFPVAAQETPEFTCDLASLQDAINIFIGELGKLKTETEPVTISNMLQQLANGANVRRAACDGLAFSGNSQKVIGPVVIPEGIYRSIATTTGYMIASITAVEGECGAGTSYLSGSLFLLNKGQGDNGAETLFTSKGCTALIEVSNVQADWKLIFERL